MGGRDGLRDNSGDIDDNMSLVCEAGVELTEYQELRKVMSEKCSVSFAQFHDNFDRETGVYTGSLDCSYVGMTSSHLEPFTMISSITGSFSLNDNTINSLESLANLTSVGGYFFVHNNQIEEMGGLSSLSSIGGNFDTSSNLLLNVNGLSALTKVNGWIKIYENSDLDDISGLTNVAAADGKKIYLDNRDYTTKAEEDGAMCSAVWDLNDGSSNNIPDDMSLICEGYSDYTKTESDRLRDLLGKRCAIDSVLFYASFSDDSGIYNGNIQCQGLTDEEMSGFAGLIEVHGNFAVEESSITTMDELIRLKRVTGTVSIANNADLIDISGLSNVLGTDGQKLIIDDTGQYDVKADGVKDFCVTSWDMYAGAENIADDRGKVCDP